MSQRTLKEKKNGPLEKKSWYLKFDRTYEATTVMKK